MPRYADPPFTHGAPARIGVLVANLGTPDAPTPAAVRRYLAEFLGDPRVVELPRALWWPLLHGWILQIRPRRTAHAYRQIWTADGSPLLAGTRALAEALRQQMAARLPAPPAVAVGMCYGNPSLPAALAELRAQQVRRLLVLPLYPQYSATTTAAVFDRVTRELQNWRWLPELRFVNDYHAEPDYIAALAGTLAGRSACDNPATHLLFSFHGLPLSYRDAGDPYYCQCLATARLVAERLALPAAAWSVAFQSRVGRQRWLEPYTENRLRELAAGGTREVTVICPGFAVDCLETLEEIALRGRAMFLAAGGSRFDYVPALHDRPEHAAALAALVTRHCRGWADGGS
ncbi:MAG: ferrochelatase [Gammaproteobacteria bacterium]|nr:ferrochelatase [Gammaproteobacteria bacterium]